MPSSESFDAHCTLSTLSARVALSTLSALNLLHTLSALSTLSARSALSALNTLCTLSALSTQRALSTRRALSTLSTVVFRVNYLTVLQCLSSRWIIFSLCKDITLFRFYRFVFTVYNLD